MSVFVIRAFIRMRSLLTDTHALASKLAALEKELTARLVTHEVAITDFMSRLFQMLDPPPAAPPPPDKEPGFHTTLKPRARP